MRLTIVTNTPTPYRTSLYEQLNRQLSERGGGLTVIYGARAEDKIQWAGTAGLEGTTPSIFIRGQVRVGPKTTYANPVVVPVLRRTRPDVVVIGGYKPWVYAAIGWARWAGVPYLLWSGETLRSVGDSRGIRLRRLPILRGAAGCLAYGPEAAEYLKSLGASPDRLTVVGNGIDVDAYAELIENARAQRDSTRAELGLERPTILSVGGKNLDSIQEAVRMAQLDADVLVVGSASEPSRSAGLVVLGKRPAEEMPRIYAAADCLAHPSLLDRWPHAINEALAGGLPVVASDLSGIPRSLVTGPGCDMVAPMAEALAPALRSALEVAAAITPERREDIRSNLRPWSVGPMAERIVEAAVATRPDRGHTTGQMA